PSPVTAVTQTQYGPMEYDPSQGSNTSDTYNLRQSSDQHNNTPGGFQDDQQFAQCFTSGDCTVTELIGQNGQTSSNSCGPASSCDTGQTQTTDSEGTSRTTCTEGCGDEFSPPPPPSRCGLSCLG